MLKKIGLYSGIMASFLAIFEFVAKRSIFFRPLSVYFKQNIEIKFGIIFLLESLVLLFLFLWIFSKNKKVANKSVETPGVKLKTDFEEFLKEGILYAFEYPIGKDDVEPWIHKKDPRCLKCQTRMEKFPVNHNPFTPSKWICKSCGHSIDNDENTRLQTQAKSRLVKRLNNKS